MKQSLARSKGLGNFSVEKPTFSQSYTTMEHALSGSTTVGWKYHPNTPEAIVGGSSLDAINVVRKEVTAHGGLSLYYRNNEGRLLILFTDLLPLTEEQIQSSEPILTFRIRSAETTTGGAMSIPLDVESGLKSKMEEIQKKGRTG